MVLAPAEAVHVGEEPHELLAVRQERAPRPGGDGGLVGAAVGHPAARSDLGDLAFPCLLLLRPAGAAGSSVVPDRGRRRG
jgi:hypothetical protein